MNYDMRMHNSATSETQSTCKLRQKIIVQEDSDRFDVRRPIYTSCRCVGLLYNNICGRLDCGMFGIHVDESYKTRLGSEKGHFTMSTLSLNVGSARMPGV